jgi:glycyl-tRNA synthetase beta chain
MSRQTEGGPARLRLDQMADSALMVIDRKEGAEKARAALCDFLKDRLYQLCLDRGAPPDIVQAVMKPDWADVADLFERLRVLQEMSRRPGWQDLVIVVERTYNIGKNAPAGDVDESALTQVEEKELWRVYEQNHDAIRALIEKRDYLAACLRMAQVFAAPVHLFFEKVFVNVEDARLRNNRLAMMKKINVLFSERIADLSQIVTGVVK